MRVILKILVLLALVFWATVQAAQAQYGVSQQVNLGGYSQGAEQLVLPAQADCYGQDVQQVILQPQAVRQQFVQPVQVQRVYAAPLRQQLILPAQAGCAQGFRSQPVRGFLGAGNARGPRKVKQKVKFPRR